MGSNALLNFLISTISTLTKPNLISSNTKLLPDEVPFDLNVGNTGPQDWYYMGIGILNNGKKCSPELPNTKNLNTNQTIGLLISSDTKLHVYLDGHHITTVSGLPVDSHLWGAVNVLGDCTKIKSELLSGELDGVCMYLYFLVVA